MAVSLNEAVCPHSLILSKHPVLATSLIRPEKEDNHVVLLSSHNYLGAA